MLRFDQGLGDLSPDELLAHIAELQKAIREQTTTIKAISRKRKHDQDELADAIFELERRIEADEIDLASLNGTART